MATPFTIPYVNTPAYFTGTANTSNLVPNTWPVAINGRPYMLDMESGEFQQTFEPRVRDSVDQSTAPSEAAINPGGLWRRGQDSWHFGAGQRHADLEDSLPYRFYKSKGINPWTKGQVSLLNDTSLMLPSTATNLNMLEIDGYLYVADGNDLRFSDEPFTPAKTATISTVSGNGTTMTYTTTANHGFTAGHIVTVTGVSPGGYNVTKAKIATASGTSFTVAGSETGTYVSGGLATEYPWKNIDTGEPSAAINSIATDGSRIYVAYVNEGVLMTTPGSTTITDHYATSGGTFNYTQLGFAKGFILGAHSDASDNNIHVHSIPYAASTSHGSTVATLRDPNASVVGIAGGQNHIYIGVNSNDIGYVYKLGIKADGTIDVAIVALELPRGEYVTTLDTYLGFVLIGTNKGARFASTDSDGNLLAGALIPTTTDVKTFTPDGRFVWFGWGNYDGTSTGLGRMDLTTFSATNTPAYATDLMYTSTNNVLGAATFNNKRVFTVSGVGVIGENTASFVASGTIETGVYRWGIPDRKFVARFDVRALPLDGSIISYMSLDGGDYTNLGAWNIEEAIETTLPGADDKAIEAEFKLQLDRATTVTLGPTLTRWMARAYAAPFRSEVFVLPVLLHNVVKLKDRDVYLDVNDERERLGELLQNPRVVALQIGPRSYAVIAEDLRWQPVDAQTQIWDWEGTATMTLRSVEN